jgi:FAD/FMN-containing dehydrogenase
MELMKPHFNGEVYQNYPRRALTAQDFRRMYWGSAFDDLLWVKKKYDPKNFFHHEQSIAPYHGSTWPTASARFGNASIVSEPY